jgi:hypothetical protein
MPERVEAVCTIIVIIAMVIICCTLVTQNDEGPNYKTSIISVTDCVKVNCDHFNNTASVNTTNSTNTTNRTLITALRVTTIPVSDCLQIICGDKR